MAARLFPKSLNHFGLRLSGHLLYFVGLANTPRMSVKPGSRPSPGVRLGLRENLPQFALLVLVNALVGAMIGLERSILPAIAEQEFRLDARTAILSFIVVFGLTKAATNFLAGRYADRVGRKPVLVAGWLIAVPVPFLLMWAPDWNWILAANVLLGASQGLAWSMTVVMKIDLVGHERRGMAMGLNEFAGYVAVAAAALATGWIAARTSLRPDPFYIGIVFAALGLALSVTVVRETMPHVALEATLRPPAGPAPSSREVFWRTTLGDRDLSSITQAGLVNNLNDGMAWGLFPLVFAGAGMSLAQIGALAAIYPATWGAAQLATGALSDRLGRKGLIVAGMWTQAVGIGVIIGAAGFAGFASGAALLGLGTAMVYPTLLAAIGDVAGPSWRASAVGVYRLWRDSGYAVGALVAGISADLIGLAGGMWIVAGITAASGTVVALRMRETLRHAAGPGRTSAMAVACPVDLDTMRLRREIQDVYARVAADPSAEFHFHRGPSYAAGMLGYDADALAALPAEVTASFAGVANPLRIAPLRAGATVVDIGCGAGMDLLLAARAVGAQGRAIGVDMTEAMAERARSAARALGLDHVEVRLGDALDLPVESGSADYVISNGVLNLTPDKARAFGEIRRILRPGGQLLLGDIVVAGELSESIRRDIDLWTG